MKQFAIGVALVLPWLWLVAIDRYLRRTALSVRRPRRDRASRQRRSAAHSARGARSRRVRARLDRMGLRGPWPSQPQHLSFARLGRAWCAALVGLVYWAVRRAPADAVAVALDVRVALAGRLHHRDQADLARRSAGRAAPLHASGRRRAARERRHPALFGGLPPIACRRALGVGQRGLLIPAGLIAMQIGFAAIQNPVIKEPLLRHDDAALPVTKRTTIDCQRVQLAVSEDRMRLARLAFISSASESWRTTTGHADC